MDWKCGNCQTKTMVKSTMPSHSSAPRMAVQPSRGGMAPGKAPTKVEIGEIFFSGVYNARYAVAVRRDRNAGRKLGVHARESGSDTPGSNPAGISRARVTCFARQRPGAWRAHSATYR